MSSECQPFSRCPGPIDLRTTYPVRVEGITQHPTGTATRSALTERGEPGGPDAWSFVPAALGHSQGIGGRKCERCMYDAQHPHSPRLSFERVLEVVVAAGLTELPEGASLLLSKCGVSASPPSRVDDDQH